MGQLSSKKTSKRASTDNSLLDSVKKLKLNTETKLTDLNYDCLYSIFKLLSLKDAVQMCAVSNKFIEPVNGIVKLSRLQYIFEVTRKYRLDRPAFCETLFYVSTLQIKWIGESITKVLVDYDGKFEDSASVVQHSILEHCTQLTELTLVGSKIPAFEYIKTSIAELEVLNLENCLLGPIFCQFSKWLPKLRTLTISNCKILDESCIHNMGTRMPTLQSIHLDTIRAMINPDEFSKTKYPICNTDAIIKANGQVKCFRSLSDMKPRRLVNISKSMNRLETLDIQIRKTHFINWRFKFINFKSLKKLVLDVTGNKGFQCPFVFDTLEELEITIDGFAEQWIFFAGSKQLKKFKMIKIGQRPVLTQLFTISSTWPNLTEVSLQMYGVCADEFTQFIRSFSNLQRFNVLSIHTPYSLWKSEIQIFEVVKRYLSNEYRQLLPTHLNGCYYSLIRLT